MAKKLKGNISFTDKEDIDFKELKKKVAKMDKEKEDEGQPEVVEVEEEGPDEGEGD